MGTWDPIFWSRMMHCWSCHCRAIGSVNRRGQIQWAVSLTSGIQQNLNVCIFALFISLCIESGDGFTVESSSINSLDSLVSLSPWHLKVSSQSFHSSLIFSSYNFHKSAFTNCSIKNKNSCLATSVCLVAGILPPPSRVGDINQKLFFANFSRRRIRVSSADRLVSLSSSCFLCSACSQALGWYSSILHVNGDPINFYISAFLHFFIIWVLTLPRLFFPPCINS